MLDTYKPQTQRILEYLQSGKTITTLGAAKFGICHLQKAIELLRKKGYKILDKWVKGKNSRYKHYWLEDAPCK